MNKKFIVDPKIFDVLIDYQKKLPAHAPESRKIGAENSYDNPAGLALLGLKDGIVNKVVPLAMSGGCWDAPNINHDDMYNGFNKLLKTSHICAGMALIRNPRWHRDPSRDDAVMPQHLKYQLHNLRNSFEDITKSIWIVLHNDYFRVYRPTIGSAGRIGAREITVKSLFEESDDKFGIVEAKLKRETNKLEERKKAKEEEAKRELARKKAIEDAKKSLSDKINEKKEKEIDLPDGYFLMKNNNGEYILWRK